MNPFDETPPAPPQEPTSGPGHSPPRQENETRTQLPLEAAPGLSTEQTEPPWPAVRVYPPDLQISWSWLHLVLFLVFTLSSLVAVQVVLYSVYAPHQKMTTDQIEQYMLSKPLVAVGGTVLVYGMVLFFLYVTLALIHERPFWSTLGWRTILPGSDGNRKNPLLYFLAGSGLSILVFGLTALVKPPENAPIEEVFKYKQTAMLFVAMAVLVAPLVEETVFRGYLYPMFARWLGVVPSIIVTGFLFGLMHGPQLGGAKSMILVMSLVGIVFTLARARTGSVFASFLMHLGYNSMIGVSIILGTHGFTQIPTTH